MQIKSKKFDEMISKFQEGGQMPAEAAAPAEATPAGPEGGLEDPLMQLVLAAAQALQTQDANLAMQVCQALVEMAGGGAPAPEQAPEGQLPVFKMGGKLSKMIKK